MLRSLPRRNPLREKEIQNEILDKLYELDIGYFWQNDSVGIKGRKRLTRYRPNGVPDILGVVKSKFFGIEVKRPGGKPSDSQIAFRNRFISYGGAYILAYSFEDVRIKLKIEGYL